MNAVASGGRRLQLLGHIHFERDGESVALSLPPKGLALLTLIAAHHDRPLSREWLAQRLWPDDDVAAARANLRRHLYLIAKLVGEDAVAVTRQTAQWDAACGVSVDLLEFDRLAGAQPLDALPFYRGELAAGLSDESILDERSAYAERYASALRLLRERARNAGDDEQLLIALQYTVAHDRLDEGAVRDLMSVRYRLGDRAGALRDFTGLQSRLRSDLEVQPEPETVALYEKILVADGKIETPSNLPAPAGTFVGRDQQLHSLAFQLRANRLITIAGAGGIGKTRLSIELGRSQLRHFTGGVWFADLRQARDERDVYERIAIACGLNDLNNAKDALEDRLAGDRCLIVLDNCEHLVDAVRAPIRFLIERSCAHVVVTSRRRLGCEGEICVNLHPLALPAEDAAPDELLRSPSVLLFLERAARVMPDVRVQFENAHSFAEIVRRLGGLPLALELVASRANLLTIDGMAKRLRDGLPSLKKIASVTQWSYDLLSENERRVFEVCAVFDGWWALETLEAILPDACGDGFEELSELVESSLVQTRAEGAEYRHSLLETTREFAARKLEESGDALRARTAHAHFWAAKLERIYPHSEGAREDEYFLPIDEAYADIRTALEFALTAQPALAVAIVSALYRYWALRGRLHEGWSAIQACEANTAAIPLSLQQRGRFAQAAGVIARELGDTERARTHLASAVECYRACGDRAREVESVWAQAKLEFMAGRHEKAKELYRSSLAMYLELGDEVNVASTIANIGSVSHSMGEFEEARAMYREALEQYERLGFLRGLAFIYRNMALAESNLGNAESSIALARRSVALSHESGDTLREGDALTVLAGSLGEAGLFEESLQASVRSLEILARSNHGQFVMLAIEAIARAAQLCGHHTDAVRFRACANALRKRKNLALGPAFLEEVDRETGVLRSTLDEDVFLAAWAAGESLSTAAVLAGAKALARMDTEKLRA